MPLYLPVCLIVVSRYYNLSHPSCMPKKYRTPTPPLSLSLSPSVYYAATHQSAEPIFVFVLALCMCMIQQIGGMSCPDNSTQRIPFRWVTEIFFITIQIETLTTKESGTGSFYLFWIHIMYGLFFGYKTKKNCSTK